MTARAREAQGPVAPRPSITSRLQTAAATSALVRSLLLGIVAIGVTVLGVAAGALVVAPIVGTANRAPNAAPISTPTTTSATTNRALNVRSLVTGTTQAAGRAWRRLDAGTTNLLARLPEPVARFALPSVAILAITGALLALFLPTRGAAEAPIRLTSRTTAPRGIAAITPRSSTRIGGRKQTPNAVEALAASGASAPDIAWRTGLPLDAVRLLLAISAAPRQLHPPTA